MLVIALLGCYGEDLDAIQADLDVVAAESAEEAGPEVLDYASLCFTRYDGDDCGSGDIDFVEECDPRPDLEDWIPCVIDGLDDLGEDGWHLVPPGDDDFVNYGQAYVLWRYVVD